jgi:hypothetical protein
MLGNTGERVSAIGLGGAHIGCAPAAFRTSIIHVGVDHGNLFAALSRFGSSDRRAYSTVRFTSSDPASCLEHPITGRVED